MRVVFYICRFLYTATLPNNFLKIGSVKFISLDGCLETNSRNFLLTLLGTLEPVFIKGGYKSG
jgi:hypothetical protein